MEDSAEENLLVSVIKENNPLLMQNMVDGWIKQYTTDRDAGLRKIMQFFITATGCKGIVSSQILSSLECAKEIIRLTEECEVESDEYPLIMSGPEGEKFRTNFCDFVQTLVKQCQHSIMYDDYLMDNVIVLLTSLSASRVRAFRHTGTLAAMKFMTALAEVALSVSIHLDNTAFECETERKKSKKKKNQDHLDSLLAQHKKDEGNLIELKKFFHNLLKSVFVDRYRDIVPEIRAICMGEIVFWIKRFPKTFLDDSHLLKYIKLDLDCEVGDVRSKCLQALQPLYVSEELKGKLEYFTSRLFKDRVVSMTLDKESDVAVQAVRLITSIHKYHREILSNNVYEAVQEVVFVCNRAVALAAGEFLNERLLTLDETSPPALRTQRGKKRLPSTPLIRLLVKFFLESEMPEHGAYLVDSLIDSNEMMKDWECMTDLLIEDPGPGEESLDDRQEASLIELMTCCIKQAATGESPIEREPARKATTENQIKLVQEDRVRLTEHFIPTIHLLLEKYITYPEIVAKLLVIPQYFYMEIYTTSREEKSLDLLLRLMHNVVDRQTETDVLENCAKTLIFLCNEDQAIYSLCDVSRTNLINGLVNKSRVVLANHQTLIADDKEPNEDELIALVSCLKKVAIFWACHNLGPWKLWRPLYKAIHKANDLIRSMPPEATKHCISACYCGILWNLLQLKQGILPEGMTTSIQQQNLNIFLDDFISIMKKLIISSNVILVRDQAYLSVCDLLIAFSEKLEVNPLLKPVVYQPNQDLQQTLTNFIQKFVFLEELEEDGDVDELHKRRIYLGGFCKLVAYNVLPIQSAAEVFQHYYKHYNNYGDIIKLTLGKAREINTVSCARTMFLSLSILFNGLSRDAGNQIDRQSEDFFSVKELAKGFALFFQLEVEKDREAITNLQKDAILFATDSQTRPPPNLAFLEIANEFTCLMLEAEKISVITFFQNSFLYSLKNNPITGKEGEPLLKYLNSLKKF